MSKIISFLLFIVSSQINAQEIKTISEIKSPDPNTWVVINNAPAGKWVDVRTDLNQLTPEMIMRINILKGETATKKYGDKGSYGVIELELKNTGLFDVKVLQQPHQPADSVFAKVDIEASFPGGDKSWRMYLERNVKAQVASDNHAPPGTYTVMAQFIVDKEGKISDIKTLTHHGFGMEEEVVRVIQKGPKWLPAIKNGYAVKAYRKQPLTFAITTEFSLSTYKLKAGEETIIELLDVAAQPHEIVVTVSEGLIMSLGEKKYTIKAGKPGQILLSVSVNEKKKKRELGQIALKVE